MKWEQTYKIETPPEPAMEWDNYEHIIISEWNSLLNSSPDPSEKTIQDFFEHYPSLVPGAFSLFIKSGHYPWYCGLISQPILPSYNYRIPDFMWISCNSESVEPVLIEIEAPGKSWFTSSGIQTAHLTQALNQIAEWKAWFEKKQNIEAFKYYYELDYADRLGIRFKPQFQLIYGRRKEANANPDITGKRAHLRPDNVDIMTYDRLRPDANTRQLICMKVDKPGAYKAISVPATLKWIPGLAGERSKINDWDRAIRANPHIPQSRKEFLVERLSYWNEWAKGPKGVISASDEE